MGPQFSRVETFAKKAHRSKRGKSRASARSVVRELKRSPGHCNHVPDPRPPVLLAGSTKGIEADLMYPPRVVTHILLGAVASWPERWDECDPTECVRWLRAVSAYYDRFWEGRVAVMALHVDEANPHVHCLVHQHGSDVKPLHPGYCAGDAAHKAALECGMSKHWANRIRQAEYKRALSCFQDHYHEHVGKPFGMARKGPAPRERWDRPTALHVRNVRDAGNPVDQVAAEQRKVRVRELLAVEGTKPLTKRPAPLDVLAKIGFVPELDYIALKDRLEADEPGGGKGGSDKRALREKLEHLLSTSRDWVEFAKKCAGANVDLLIRRDNNVVAGITFRSGNRAFSGSSLGPRFAWPALSKFLEFNPSDKEHEATLISSELRADAVQCRIEPDEIDDGQEALPAPPKKPWHPKPIPLSASASSRGTSYQWPSGRVAVKEEGEVLTVVDISPDVVIFALELAMKRGWRKLKLTASGDFIERIAASLRAVAKRLGILLRFVGRGGPLAQPAGVRGEGRLTAPAQHQRARPRPVALMDLAKASAPKPPVSTVLPQSGAELTEGADQVPPKRIRPR